jgi:hypothetical protein
MLKFSYAKDKLVKKELIAINNSKGLLKHSKRAATDNSKGLLKYNKRKAENNNFNLKTDKALFTSLKLS